MPTADLAHRTVQTSSGDTQETRRNKVKEKFFFFKKRGSSCCVSTAVLVFVLAFI